MKYTILVTGCCGYIGSHTTVELLKAGYNVIGIDDFSNSQKDVINNIYKITGRNIIFYEGNVIDTKLLKEIFKENRVDVVIDFAAYKSVGDSVNNPISYYTNNIVSLLSIINIMQEFNVKRLIFSSTAAVYGTNNKMPLNETSTIGNTINPYATSKLFCEKILEDTYSSDSSWDIIVFRYFNPVGAHKSGLLKENPKGLPSNLMPCILNVAKGTSKKIVIYGDKYKTKDGTGVRDYIHVMDLAKAHIMGIEKILNRDYGYKIYNLGTGVGYSVLDVIKTFERVNNVKIEYSIGKERIGDLAICYASPLKAERELNWKAEKDLDDMCIDAYRTVK